MVRILLVDDQPQVRRGLQMNLALEPDVVVVGEATDGNTMLALISSLQPDVIIMDVAMPETDAFALTKTLTSSKLPRTVIILSIHDDSYTQEQAYAAGAAAFVSKRESPEHLIAAIRHVMNSD